MRSIDTIIVHCSATPPTTNIGVNEITSWHVDENGWNDIGYHFVIRRNGEVENGRDVEKPGAHAKGFNKNSIGICLVGGVDNNLNPENNFTLDQFVTLRALIKFLRDGYDIKAVLGHRDLPGVSKACPSFDVGRMLRGETTTA